MTDPTKQTVPRTAAADTEIQGSKRKPSTRHLGRTRSGSFIAAFGCLIIAFDGYDISAYGTTVPAMLDYAPWNASAAALGLVGSLTLVGMLAGSLICGFATDRLGRKIMLILTIGWFSVCMIGCAVAPTLAVFGVFRFLAGMGLGGVLPIVVAFVIEFAPPRRRNTFNGFVHIGFPLGTIAASMVGISVLGSLGFRPMYAFAALPLLLLPVAWFVLPESAAFLASKGRVREAAEVAARFRLELPSSDQPHQARPAAGRIRTLLDRGLLPKLVLFGLCGAFVQLIIYGLNTWLPQLMRQAGYPSTSALTLLATLSAGAVVGGITFGFVADRWGPRTVTCLAFTLGAIALAILSAQPPAALAFVAAALAGAGSNGTANVLYGYVGTWAPAQIRASALGSFISLARIGGIVAPMSVGWIIAAGLPTRWNFLALLVPAVLGVVVTLALPRTRTAQTHV
ncbi:aromatic acid/H+ symport family MFS transporter [Amycolatopsis rubida]|uniref:Aromatic acid/H+ symport family MFS transporter n=1 Tax=Amycolatopsis rubida TaxID=112413 RepID=A0ABX0C0L1_9PSEU|nr:MULTISPECIES: aromatic acid/H+ symport family MFS transporter [Amycolatopsis]MYW96225.1 MFS transporter [Amycolatopsis rubida]NEC61216.1 aromatic acid/H+ symport family MFS transporter [Amycolatopsis rubida]OAP24258.1 4-hydroxybenzoate transporter PcaK [Amycolatopsis sp. M39]